MQVQIREQHEDEWLSMRMELGRPRTLRGAECCCGSGCGSGLQLFRVEDGGEGPLFPAGFIAGSHHFIDWVTMS